MDTKINNTIRGQNDISNLSGTGIREVANKIINTVLISLDISDKNPVE